MHQGVDTEHNYTLLNAHALERLGSSTFLQTLLNESILQIKLARLLLSMPTSTKLVLEQQTMQLDIWHKVLLLYLAIVYYFC